VSCPSYWQHQVDLNKKRLPGFEGGTPALRQPAMILRIID
jgi:hypothetical protein